MTGADGGVGLIDVLSTGSGCSQGLKIDGTTAISICASNLNTLQTNSFSCAPDGLALGGARGQGHGIFSIVSVGESLMVKEVGEKYDLTYMQGMPAPYKITALGDDFIELSIGPMVQRIPVTSIRAIQVQVAGK